MPDIAVVVLLQCADRALLQPFLDAVPASFKRPGAVQWVWAWDCARADDPAFKAMQAQLRAWHERGAWLAEEAVVGVQSLAQAIAATRAPWLLFTSVDLHRPDAVLDEMARWAKLKADATLALAGEPVHSGLPTAQAVPAFRLERLPQRLPRLLRRSALPAAARAACAELRPSLAADVLTWYLLLQPQATVASIAMAAGAPAGAREPEAALWRDKGAYDTVLRLAFAEPMALAASAPGGAPAWLQLAVLEHLHWYFSVDGRDRAPTVTCDAALAPTFHERVRETMQHVNADVLAALPASVATEVRHALWSYKQPTWQSAVSADAYDHVKDLVRLTWWVHGEPTTERITVAGHEVQPRYAKWRGCKYFGRLLLRQRIAWVGAAQADKLQVLVAGEPFRVGVGPAAFTTTSGALAAATVGSNLSLAQVRTAYPPNKGGQLPLPPGWRGWRVRLLKALARLPWVRRRYRDAWVFIDREEGANDNAEHLYRWVLANRPEINCWFMLLPDTADWRRLQAEGFKLVGPGLARKLLILNSRHIISSHTDYVFGGMDRRLYGEAMRWRYTFLQHGVIKDDLSHWLGPREFDRFITSSPQEHASVVGDDTAYPYTDREVRRTGLPRYDRLLRFANAMPPEEVRTLLIMPTWRGSLADERMVADDPEQRLAAFAGSAYARHWRALLNNPMLTAAGAAAGVRIEFMPHANAAPFLQAFGIPHSIEPVRGDGEAMQKAFARCVALVTDYSSVAFDMALLRRQVFYYQFDRDSFFRGGHNWREGYFDYSRDGFGPVCTSEGDIVQALVDFIDGGCKTEATYLRRMESAMPDRDEQACRRTFDSIIDLYERTQRGADDDRPASRR